MNCINIKALRRIGILITGFTLLGVALIAMVATNIHRGNYGNKAFADGVTCYVSNLVRPIFTQPSRAL